MIIISLFQGFKLSINVSFELDWNILPLYWFRKYVFSVRLNTNLDIKIDDSSGYDLVVRLGDYRPDDVKEE